MTVVELDKTSRLRFLLYHSKWWHAKKHPKNQCNNNFLIVTVVLELERVIKVIQNPNLQANAVYNG